MSIFIRHAKESVYFVNKKTSRAYDDRILYILGGEGEIDINGKTYAISENTMCFYPSATPYFPKSSSKNPLKYISLNFDFSLEHKDISDIIPISEEDYDEDMLLDREKTGRPEIYKSAFVIDNCSLYRSDFLDIVKFFTSNTPYAKEISAAILEMTLLKIANSNFADENSLYFKILDYINKNYTKIRSNAEIARALSYHEYYINRVFKQMQKTTVHRYILEKRLNKAQSLLASTDKSIGEVACEVGFVNANHFSRAYKDYFGVPPTQRKLVIAMV